MVQILRLTNMTAPFLLDLNGAVNIKMSSFKALSTLQSFVLSFLGVKNKRSYVLLLIARGVKKAIIDLRLFIFFHRLIELIISLEPISTLWLILLLVRLAQILIFFILNLVVNASLLIHSNHSSLGQIRGGHFFICEIVSDQTQTFEVFWHDHVWNRSAQLWNKSLCFAVIRPADILFRGANRTQAFSLHKNNHCVT